MFRVKLVDIYATLKNEATETDLLVFKKGVYKWVRLEDKMEVDIKKHFEANIKQPIIKLKYNLNDDSLKNVATYDEGFIY